MWKLCSWNDKSNYNNWDSMEMFSHFVHYQPVVRWGQELIDTPITPVMGGGSIFLVAIVQAM